MRSVITILILFFLSCNLKKNDKIASKINFADTITRGTKIKNDSIVISERIDGPANVRDSVNGRLIFSLYDNVNVTATEAQNGWLQVGIIADISQEQLNSLIIIKGSKLFIDGMDVGQTLENIRLYGAFKTNEGLKGELSGYTSISNIKTNTVPEIAFSKIINSTTDTLTIKNFEQFLKDFQFSDYNSLLPQFKSFEIDENWIDDPSPLLRLWLIFRGENFYGVFHSRPLDMRGASITKVKRGFYFSTFSKDNTTNKELINSFNSFISQVD